MSEIAFETKAYAKIILHAAKYPHCAVNGLLLADASKLKDTSRNQDIDIVDAVPLFHHSHYVTPMAEVALTQIEATAQVENSIIAGYYAACENFKDNTIEKCPGQKIAEKIADNFPSALFVVVDNKKFGQNLESPAIKLHQHSDGKWKLKDMKNVMFYDTYVLETVSHMLQKGVQKDLVDFDNYLDDLTLDWTNLGIQKLVSSLTASKNATDSSEEKED
ncbi:hypothetical protein EVAR_7318_1 [Eumeta japonica]|uniref:MPN domain-containing protein n=1 Tax=Eumeta variegata TaxID=151549 RepID=A0A4C1T2T4_EUMVA|nr:hypothetical protein EVAR_7318_1 [Eumeta japonica]